MNSVAKAVLLTTMSAAMVAGGQAWAADPTTADCLGATESSLTLRNQHKLRDARAQLLICSAATCPADIRDECTRRVAEVNAAMPTIVFEVKDSAGNDVTGVRAVMDGEVLAEHLEGTAISIDPGEHAFTFQHATDPPVQKGFVINEGEKGRRERVVLGLSLAAAAPTVARVLSAPAAPPATDRPSSYWSGRRIGALTLAAIGLAGVAVGTGFGLAALSRHDDAEKVCPHACVDQHGVDLWNSAHSAGTISTVAFIAGGVGLAGGAVLWFTARGETGPATQVALGPGTVGLRGAW